MGRSGHRLIKGVLKWGGILFLLVIATVGILWFAMRDQVIAKVLDIVESRMAEDGVYMRYGEHRLSATRGLVLNELTLYADEERESRIALIENIGIWIPIWELLRNDAEITLSSDLGRMVLDSRAGSLEISELDMALRCTIHSVEMERLNARIKGVRLEVDGIVHLPPSEGSGQFKMSDLSPVVKGAEWIDFSGGNPTVKVQVATGPDGKGVDLSGSFSGQDFSWKGYEFDQVSFRLALGEDVIHVPEAVINAYGGRLNAELEVDHENHLITIPSFESGGNPLAMIRAYAGPKFFSEFDLPAGLDLSGKEVRIDLNEPTQSEGHLMWKSEQGVRVQLGEREFEFTDLEGDVTYTDGLLAIGKFDAEFSGLAVSVTGDLDPSRLAGSESEGTEGLAVLESLQDWLDFSGEVPVLNVEVDHQADGGMNLKGAFSGSKFKWRNIEIGSIASRFVFAGESVEIPEFSADCYGGSIAGKLVVDYQKSQLLVEELTSSVDPFGLVDAIMEWDKLKPFSVLGPTELKGEKICFDLKKFSRSTGHLSVNAPGGFVLPVGRSSVQLQDFHGGVSFEDGRLVVNGDRFSIYRGKGSGVYSMPLSGAFNYRLKVKAAGLSLSDLGKAQGAKNDLVGSLSGNFDGGGARGGKSFHGLSRVTISGCRFFSVPILDDLMSFLANESEGFGKDVANDLHGSFRVEDGVVHSSDLEIESSTSVLHCKGWFDFMNNMVKGDVRANLKGVAGLATGVVSWALTLHGEGPHNNVRWTRATPVIDGAKTAGDAIKDVGSSTGKLLEKGASWLLPNKKGDGKE